MKKINKILKIGTLFAAPLLASASILTLTSCSSNSDNSHDIPNGGDWNDQGDQPISPEDIVPESGYVLNESKTGIIEKNGDDSNQSPFLIKTDSFKEAANRTKDGKEIHYKVSLKVEPGYYYNHFGNIFENDNPIKPMIRNSWYKFKNGFDIEYSFFKEDNGNWISTPISDNLKWYQNENFDSEKKENFIRLPIENQYILDFHRSDEIYGLYLETNSYGIHLGLGVTSDFFKWSSVELDRKYIQEILKNEKTSYEASNDEKNNDYRYVNIAIDNNIEWEPDFDVYFHNLKYSISVIPYLK